MHQRISKLLVGSGMAALLVAPAWVAAEMPLYPVEWPGASQVQPAHPAAQARIGEPLHVYSPRDLYGARVIDMTGQPVGTVTNVLSGPDQERAHVVVTPTDATALGDRQFIIPLGELMVAEGQLRLDATGQQLHAYAELPPQPYAALPPDRPIGEFAAFEPITRPGTGLSAPQSIGPQRYDAWMHP